jgi:1-acyl-sn-glycerol-3-phosphate acyltransferase
MTGRLVVHGHGEVWKARQRRGLQQSRVDGVELARFELERQRERLVFIGLDCRIEALLKEHLEGGDAREKPARLRAMLGRLGGEELTPGRELARVPPLVVGERRPERVGNHCLDLVDPLMLTVAVRRETGRLLRFIAHGNLFFTIPGLRTLAPIWGLIPNRHVELADAALRDEGALMLYPGSGTEAILRSYRREPYRLKWDAKHGFVQLAARHRATILFVAGIGIDEMYYQTDVPMPASAIGYGNAGDADYYQGARLQIGAAGLHVLPGVLPLPVRITHVISPPLMLDPDLDPDDGDAVAHAQVRLWAESQAFLDATVAARATDLTDLVDRGLRGAMSWLQKLGV